MAKLRLVHSDDYLASLQEPDALTAILGFELPDEHQDRVLAAQRAAVGGTLLATQLALSRNGVSVNLGGGFHHASAEVGHGFCAFNDIAVAIRDCRSRGYDLPVLVIDLDLHDGDGTRAIFADDPTVHTLSIHNRDLGETEAQASTSIELGAGVTDARFRSVLGDSLPPIVEQVRPGLVFYLAGCDVAADDALGNWDLSSNGVFERDRYVVSSVTGEGDPIPLVILPAGGYGRAAWRYTARFLVWLLTGESTEEPHASFEPDLADYRKIGRLLSVPQLTSEPAEEGLGLTDEDLNLVGPPRVSRLLGFFSKHGVELALERFGLLDRVRAAGYSNLSLEFDLDRSSGQTVRLLAGGESPALLAEIRVRRDSTTLKGFELLAVEWLLLQNPRAEFTHGRPRLPGQNHPGLGLLREVAALLVLACEQLRFDGLSLVPGQFHIVALGHSLFHFLSPEDEGRFRALRSALRALPLREAIRAIEEKRVIESGTGMPFSWEPTTLILPVSDRLRNRILDPEYERQAREAASNYGFEVRHS